MSERSTPVFFPISLFKLLMMSTATLGFYSLYWFYKNWRFVQLRTANAGIVPKWRACLAVFYCYPLLKNIKQVALSHQISMPFSPIVLSLAWVGLMLCINLPNPYYFASLFSVLALLPAQRVVNKLNDQLSPDHNSNGYFSGWNVVIIIAGTVVYTVDLS